MHKQIENLSIEQMREIVEGAPEGAQLYKTHFNLVGYAKLQTHFVFMATTTFKNGFGDKVVWKIMGCRSVLKFKPKKFNKLEDLREAIAEHDEDHCNHEWNDITSNGDKYRSLVCKHCDSTKNYLPLDEDHVTDIRNHLSPSTVVVDL